jgi:hypothetical protein
MPAVAPETPFLTFLAFSARRRAEGKKKDNLWSRVTAGIRARLYRVSLVAT